MMKVMMIAALLLAPAIGASAHPSIDIVVSNTKFLPSTIELHVGETTTLRLTASEDGHSLESADLGIPKTTIVPGTLTTIVVTPTKAGTFVVPCADHPEMTLTVKVLP